MQVRRFNGRACFDSFGENHNRELWSTKIKVPYLDLNEAGGGLSPIKKGGGFQTLSLRLLGNNGHQYALRSIDKDPEKILPPGLRNTFAQTILKDQISVANPYGAFAIQDWPTASEFFIPNPSLYMSPSIPTLGIIWMNLGACWPLFEIRPAEDLSEFNRFGNAHNAVTRGRCINVYSRTMDNEIDTYLFAKVDSSI